TTAEERQRIVNDRFGKRGASVVVEAAGALPAFSEGVDLTGNHGRYIVLGLWGAIGTQPISPRDLTIKNIHVSGATFAKPKHFYQAMHFAAQMQERYPLASLITQRFSIADAGKALDQVKTGNLINPVIDRNLDDERQENNKMSTETATNPALAPVPSHVREHLVFDFDMYNPPNLAQGAQLAWATLQGPNVPEIVWTQRNGGHWIASRAQLIREAYENPQIFSSQCPFIPREAGEAYDFIPTSMDPPEQRKWRAILNKVAGLPVVDDLETQIRDLSRSLIGELRLKGECNFTEAYAEPFPIRIFMLMADLPHKDIPHL